MDNGMQGFLAQQIQQLNEQRQGQDPGQGDGGDQGTPNYLQDGPFPWSGQVDEGDTPDGNLRQLMDWGLWRGVPSGHNPNPPPPTNMLGSTLADNVGELTEPNDGGYQKPYYDWATKPIPNAPGEYFGPDDMQYRDPNALPDPQVAANWGMDQANGGPGFNPYDYPDGDVGAGSNDWGFLDNQNMFDTRPHSW